MLLSYLQYVGRYKKAAYCYDLESKTVLVDHDDDKGNFVPLLGRVGVGTVFLLLRET